MKHRKLRTYDKGFKLNAIKLYIQSGRSYEEISEELGIPKTTLIGWMFSHRKHGGESFPGKGNLKEFDQEMAQLRKRLSIAEEERDILKKALGIFSSMRK